MFPALPPCPDGMSAYWCNQYLAGYSQAVEDAAQGGYLDKTLFPSLSEAQTLLPAIILVLATAFGARLIIQLVKG